MRHDEIVSTPSLDAAWPMGPRHVAPGWRGLGLALLVGATSLAVGATTSFWLVPAYLLAMGWLLLSSPAAPPQDAGSDGPARQVTPAPAKTEESGLAEAIVAGDEPGEEPGSSGEGASRPRTKRRSRGGRGRAKARVEPPPPSPPMLATWVQVAPGKFVRVEVPAPTQADDGEPTGPEIAPAFEAEAVQTSVRPEESSPPGASEEPVKSESPGDSTGPDGTTLGDAGLLHAESEAPDPWEAAGTPERVGDGTATLADATSGEEGTPEPRLAGPRPAPETVEDPTPDAAPALLPGRAMPDSLAASELPAEATPAKSVTPATEAPAASAENASPASAAGMARPNAFGRSWSARVRRASVVRRDPRLAPRRLSGRIGGSPRVVCKRG